MKSDKHIFNLLEQRCPCVGKFIDDVCVELSLANDNVFTGNIRHLGLSEKQEILELISKLHNLQKLDLRKNKLNSIENFQMPNLNYLDVGSNDLKNVPEWIKDCPLKYLNLGANNLAHLPDWFSDLSLETLKVHKNKITFIPKLKSNLKHFNFYLNSIKEVPSFIFSLSELTYLCFGALKFKELDVSNFVNLNWLSVILTDLEELPENIINLPIKGLRLVKNNIKRLPIDIGKMKSLTHLALYGNLLESLPLSFFELNLSKLNLRKNNLSIETIEKVKNKFNSLEFFDI